jgi:hypothetical protein
VASTHSHQLVERGSRRHGTLGQRRDAHQPAKLERRLGFHCCQYVRQPLRGNAALLRFAGNAHFDQDAQAFGAWGARGRAFAELTRELDAVDRVHPGHVWGHLASLVPLQMSDCVPGDR